MNKYMEMKTFCAVVENGSFVKASEALLLSKTAVSRYVSELEGRLGVQLLRRSTRRISLTDSGELFYSKCRRLLFDIHEAESETVSSGAEVNGKIRFTAPVSFGLKYLNKIWGRFHDENPEISLDVILSNRLSDLVNDNFDLAIRIGCPPKSNYSSKKLLTTHLILCASPEYIQRRGRPAIPSELSSHDTISSSYWLTGREWRFNGKQGPETIAIDSWFQSNNSDTCISLAKSNHGIVWQPAFLVQDEISKGELVQLLPDYSPVEIGIFAVYPSKMHIPVKTKTLLQFLIDSFKDISTE